jgi:F-type H+-transporting ATPase subunit b
MKRASKIISLSLLVTPMLIACDGAISKDDFISKLFPNVWDALATFLAFIVLLLVAFYFGYKPVKKLIKKRGDYVEGKIKDADKKEKQASENLVKAEQKIKDSNVEAMAIVEKAKEDALLEKQRIAQEAKLAREEEVKKAKEQIAQEIEASKDEVHKEIVSVALDASKKVLSREVNSKDNEKLIDDFIKDLDK